MVGSQAVSIYGTACLLQRCRDGYEVVHAQGAAVITSQPSRFLAVAKAAEALRCTGGSSPVTTCPAPAAVTHGDSPP